MVESKTSSLQPPNETTRAGSRSPERWDGAHGQLGQPHITFARSPRPVEPTAATGSSPVAGGPGDSPAATDAAPADRMPTKLRQRMERLMADLADLAVVEGPELYVPGPDELVEEAASEAGAEVDPENDGQAVTIPLPAASLSLPPAILEQAPEELAPSPTGVASPELDPSIVSAPAAVSAAFSQQAREVLEILKRRQEQLSCQKNELELREAAIEKQLRQERLALVEKQRQLEAQADDWAPTSLASQLPSAQDASATADPVLDDCEASSGSRSPERKITPEWIARHERRTTNGSNLPPDAAPAGVVSDRDAATRGTEPTLAERQEVSWELVPRSAEGAELPIDTSPATTAAMPGLKEQADQLRRQHQSAIKAMQQTRRQLELLKDIVVQQQQEWAAKWEQLEGERVAWEQSRESSVQQWQSGLEELGRLRSIEQSDASKRETFLEQREAAVRALEERLQQTQVEVLRDRVVLKQLERTVRQSLSNADWNQRWQIISEETQAYLKKVQQEAELLRTQTKRQVERLESRRSEMLMYRESLRRWIERQMKLICRRAAHSDDREADLRKQSADLHEERRRLTAQQAALHQMTAAGLLSVDERLQDNRARLRA